ncbi:hypothetical protein J3R80_08820 [Aliiroseovarius sp. Z3]|uniref:hypothetical protein n=1 Tax=Aliiroseovarius sp. Z3 TaxID=2811402 RepID=UPI0023B33225|nr:hypothetical protein [Aliiroseovarius sp. Z3]MDE9450567.1 hypothetical protein [Aliiroseovarius sp. Z3]
MATDDILRQKKLLLDVPEQQEGLIQSVPDNLEPIELLNRYRSEEKLRCGVCRTDRKHLSGVTILLSDGSKVLSGLDCAKKHFGGEKIERLRMALQSKEDAIRLQQLVGPTLAACEETLAILSEHWVHADQNSRSVLAELGSSELRYQLSSQLKELSSPFFRVSVTNLIDQLDRLVKLLSKPTIPDAELKAARKKRQHIAGRLRVLDEKHRKINSLQKLDGVVEFLNGRKDVDSTDYLILPDLSREVLRLEKLE